MIKRLFTILVLFIILVCPQFIYANSYEDIEIFDPQLDKVVKTVPMNQEINNMVKDWIDEIDGICQSIDPIRDDGYVIRFPLNPAIVIENKWMDTIIEDIFLIVPEKETLFFIAFNTENNPVCFLFPGEIDKLSNLLNFQLK